MEPTHRMTHALERLKDTFRITPEMRLSTPEAAQLCDIDTGLCHAILTALEDVRCLRRDSNGVYRMAVADAFD